MKLSVIIPTYNRLSVLQQCLQRLSRQTQSMTDFEVVVVDDGSTDDTPKTIPELLSNLPYAARYFRQNNSGPARARNKGMDESRGDILLIIGDDILATETLLARHSQAHRQKENSPMALIGRLEWDLDMEITPFMRYLDNGIQFAFKDLTNETVNYRHCYTANVSVPRTFLQDSGIRFNETFPNAAFEDIEWGYRLEKAGITFRYDAEALGYHHHPVTLASYKKRTLSAGQAYAHLVKLHPELDKDKKSSSLSFRYFHKACRSYLREFILAKPALHKLLKKTSIGRNEEKWIRSILGFYLEKGMRENA